MSNDGAHEHLAVDVLYVRDKIVLAGESVVTPEAPASPNGVAGQGDLTALTTRVGVLEAAPPPVILPGFTLVKEYIHTGAAVSEFDFDAVLDGDADGGYLLDLQMVNPLNGARFYHLRLNGAVFVVTPGAYDGYQVPGGYLLGTSGGDTLIARDLGSATPALRAGPSITRIPNAASGQLRRSYSTEMSAGNGTTPFIYMKVHSDITTPTLATPIISMGVAATNAAVGGAVSLSIGAGSRAVLYKTAV